MLKPVFTLLVAYNPHCKINFSDLYHKKQKIKMFNSKENTVCYFFWHLPVITFANDISCVYLCVNKGIRPKVK